MTLLARALVRNWHSATTALAHARVGLVEAQASQCPYATREWTSAVLWLEWLVGRCDFDWRPATLEEIHETMQCHRPQMPRYRDRKRFWGRGS
jgi:hypothetical protein